ncbi:hypothetical protein [uncultured Nocardioides sp.]|uniref:hypothetical protein n=2 Tax=uncultured Nocardioides sp. TaxID=198441 RepID=UPI002607D9F4|nr:hypothetical protein [uncultured Nocardioides sp.]
MMGWYDNDMGAAGWVFMIAAMMIFWGLVATHTSSGITRVGVPRGQMIFRGTAGGRGGLGRQDLGALEILDVRFARGGGGGGGEIGREDYGGRKSALSAGAR